MIRKSQKGMTMIITLIVIFVFTVLGAAIWQYGINSVNQAEKSYKQKQAYYIARSGAEAIYSFILNESDDTAALKNKIDSLLDITSMPVNIADGSCIITLKRDGSEISIESVGDFNGVTSTATLEIKEIIDTGMPPYIFKNVIFATGDITLSKNVDIIGTLESKSTIEINGSTPPASIENSLKSYPSVIFPNNNSIASINVESYKTTTIVASGYYDEINVEQDGTLQIDLTGGDLKIVANEIFVAGQIKIQGTGRLLLYTKSLKTMDNYGEINIANESLSIDSFMVLMPPEGEFNVNRFRGLLYAPGAKVILHGSNTFTGAMVAGSITNNDNSDITYVNEANYITESYFDGLTDETTTIRYEKGKWK